MDKYDTLEYSRVKATAVSVRLRIYLCAFKNTNSPFIISKVTRPGSFELITEDGDPVPNSWNIDQLRRFYA